MELRQKDTILTSTPKAMQGFLAESLALISTLFGSCISRIHSPMLMLFKPINPRILSIYPILLHLDGHMN